MKNRNGEETPKNVKYIHITIAIGIKCYKSKFPIFKKNWSIYQGRGQNVNTNFVNKHFFGLIENHYKPQ